MSETNELSDAELEVGENGTPVVGLSVGNQTAIALNQELKGLLGSPVRLGPAMGLIGALTRLSASSRCWKSYVPLPSAIQHAGAIVQRRTDVARATSS